MEVVLFVIPRMSDSFLFFYLLLLPYFFAFEHEEEASSFTIWGDLAFCRKSPKRKRKQHKLLDEI